MSEEDIQSPEDKIQIPVYIVEDFYIRWPVKKYEDEEFEDEE